MSDKQRHKSFMTLHNKGVHAMKGALKIQKRKISANPNIFGTKLIVMFKLENAYSNVRFSFTNKKVIDV